MFPLGNPVRFRQGREDIEERYGHFHPAFQAEVRGRLDGKQAPNVMEFPVAAVFGSGNVHKARAA
ncbi:hypothetical protein PUR21_21690 [Methylorubrum rhodesianum]|uniref:Uncharacterized protein n=1 Tax=Methylorubrum rhodesianum TaxID=29427 RepID=A0ABU9ZGM4_9HYPH